MIHETILKNNSLENKFFAFGLGLERLCMIFFDIPDIRYFWSNDPKFTEQFSADKITKFKPYSTLPSQSDDISFWIDNSQLITYEEKLVWLQENDFNDFIRNLYPEWIESLVFVSSFTHPKNNKYSRLYRITFSPDNSSMINPAEFTSLRLEMFNNLKSKIKESGLMIELR